MARAREANAKRVRAWKLGKGKAPSPKPVRKRTPFTKKTGWRQLVRKAATAKRTAKAKRAAMASQLVQADPA